MFACLLLFSYPLNAHHSKEKRVLGLTEAGLDAAGVYPDSVSSAGLTTGGCRRVGPGAIAPSYTHITCPTAGTPLGPAAPAAVHYEADVRQI